MCAVDFLGGGGGERSTPTDERFLRM